MKSILGGLTMRTMARAVHCPVQQPPATQALSPGNVLVHRRCAPRGKHTHIPKNQSSTEGWEATHGIFIDSMSKQQLSVYTGLNKILHLFNHFHVSSSFLTFTYSFLMWPLRKEKMTYVAIITS